MHTIKNVIFDLGKVLLDFDNDNAKNYLVNLGASNYDSGLKMLHSQNVFTDFETGSISSQEFIEKISEQLGEKIDNSEIENAWNSILMDFRAESLKHLEQLKSRFDLFLLSNTNIIHHREFDKLLFSQLQSKSLDGYFKKAYYSHQIGLRKPNPEIYEFVLSDSGISAETTLFIDDMPENIAAAHQIGFATHLLLPDERIENLKSLSI